MVKCAVLVTTQLYPHYVWMRQDAGTGTQLGISARVKAVQNTTVDSRGLSLSQSFISRAVSHQKSVDKNAIFKLKLLNSKL